MKTLTSLPLIVLSFVCYATTSTQEIEQNTDDCIFDQTTQTDSFLEDIPELEDYVWIDSLKQAVILLENGETLKVTKGGCIHFNTYIELVTDLDKTPITDTEYWIDRVHKYTVLLDNVFDNELADSLITSESYDVNETPSQLYFSFHQDIFCHMSLIIENKHGQTSVQIGYYVC